MKKVFSSNYDTIHTFAQQTQSEGRTSNGNVFFEGKKIYSYGHHYLLGEFIDRDTIVINDKGYSNSTAKHINILIGATSQYKQYYKTKTDIEYIYSHVFNYLRPKLAKARKPQIYLNDIFYYWKTLNTYLTERKLKTKANKDPKYKELKKFVNSLQDKTSIQDLKEWAKQEKQKKQEREKQELKQKLQKFREYKTDFFRIGKEDFLRLSECAQYVETSQGVKIDIQEAKRYLKLLKTGAQMRGVKIGHYTTISFDKLLRIGCHNISKEQINYIDNLI